MKVLLREDINNLGYAGEVMEVADGYGRNFLIPRGMAVKVTPSVLKSAEVWRDRAAIRMQEVKKEHQALAERIEATSLDFTARAGETGKLYGSITTADITEQLNDALGTDIDRRIIVSDPLRQLGEHKVTVRLSRDFQPEVTVIVSQFEEEVEEEIAEVDEVDVVADLDGGEVIEDASEVDEESVESEEVEEEATEVEEVDVVADLDGDEVTDEASEVDEETVESEEEAETDMPLADEDDTEIEAEDAEADELIAEEEA